MKLVIKTTTPDVYFVHLPNYLDLNNVDKILEEAKYELPQDVVIVSHYINSDDLTNDERKQLDIYGEIKHPMIPLHVDLFVKS